MDSIDFAQKPRTDAPAARRSNPHDSLAPEGEAGAPQTVAIEGPSARFGRSLAVVIGIDAYGEGISPLRSAVADAKAIAEALQRDHAFETRCLYDDAARLPSLLALLREELPSTLGPNDRLLFYFAGHGVAPDGATGPAGYLLPVDARRSDCDSFLPMHALHRELARLPVRHALVILDCCFAGTFRWSSLRDVELDAPKVYRERYDRFVESAAWQVLTSASSDQPALDVLGDRGEGSGTCSPFAHALLDGLAGAADYTADNLITASELALFLRERVELAVELTGRRQTPQYFALDRHDRGEFVFQVPNRPLDLPPAPPLTAEANPYRGLRSFAECDRKLFFGRDAVTQRLIDAVAAQPLTVVVGPSGCGKSSVVHAGLVPALLAKGWTVLSTQRPGRSPLVALSALTRDLRGGSEHGVDAVAAWLAAVRHHASEHPEQPCLVIVDQLEELQTHRTSALDQAAFLGALASALQVAPSLHLIVTVRSDLEPQFHDSPLGPWWTAARFAVPAMSREELREVIEKPATASVLHFDNRLVDRLIDDVALAPAPLPLLSFALSELYRECWQRWCGGDRDRSLRASDYEAMGSVARALTQRANALYSELVAEDPAHATTIRNVLVRMVAIVSGEVARRRVPRDELVYDDPAEDQRVADVLQRFHEARLIALGNEKTEDGKTIEYAEPIHDELVRGWTKVSHWLDELDTPAGTRGLLGALTAAVRLWQANMHHNSYLWSDPRADLADALGRERPFMLNAREAVFVRNSASFRRNRRVRMVESLLGNRRMLARSYRETGRQLLLDGYALQAIPYLVEARKVGALGPPLRMLFCAATRNQLLAPPLEHQNVVRYAAFSPDGTRVVTASWDKTARVWDAATSKPVTPPLEHRDRVVSAAFSPDGARVVTASTDSTARVWNGVTGQPVIQPLGHQGAVWSAAFSPDGTRVVTASWDKTARVWDATTGGSLTPPLEHHNYVWSASFSPDGARVVTASWDKTARVWDAATGKPLTLPLEHQGHVVSAAFSPDGARVVTASEDGTARLWDATTGKPLTPPLEHQGQVWCAAFSSDGARVVTASSNLSARVWDVTTGKPLTPPIHHPSIVSGAAFNPDGTRIITTSDHTACLWDATTGEALAAPFQHQGRVTSAAFSSDGVRVVTASEDKAARVWDASTGQLFTPPLEHWV